jgi:cytidylate kinase
MSVVHSSPSLEKKIVICISGMAGCGKSTVARNIAERYNLRYVSGGDALKALALKAGYKNKRRGWWESSEGIRFLKERTRDFSFDRAVDEKLLKLAEKGDVVLDSWALPWLLKGGFKIWLEASQQVRAQRVAERDRLDAAKARAILTKKDADTKLVYRRLYGFNLGEDFSPFDLILDVNCLSQPEVFEALSLAIDRLLQPTKRARLDRLVSPPSEEPWDPY